MAIYGTNILELLLCLGIIKECVSYNIDVSHARVLKGPKDSLFGYTTVFHRTDEGYKLIVGAPKADSDLRAGTGVTFRCDVSGSLGCEKEYTIRDPNYPDSSSVSGSWYNDNETYGSFILQTVNNSLVVCAPRYNDLSFESRGFRFLIGRCVYNGQSIRPLFRTGAKDYLEKVSTGPGITQTIFWNGMGQCGLSGDALADGSILLGVPGFMESRGGVIMIQSAYVFRSLKTEMDIPEFSYIGYSLVTGNFCGKGNLCYATGGPRKESGKVFLYLYIRGVEINTLIQTLQGEQTGSYFGASLCAVDVNGDGIDDLLVGAPFYTDAGKDNDNSKKVFVDEGRVTVFLNVNDAGNGLKLQKSVVLKGSNEDNARFGTAITNIGDINNDGYNDVAIGAPYEDEGRGAVYIYHGGEGGLQPEVKQRIMGRVINDTVTSFGWSISKPQDIDNNKYPDITVGGYLSDSAVILRTRPVVNTQVTIETDPELIIRDKSLCPLGFDSDRCFRLKLCFRYTGPSLPRQLNYTYTLTVDTYAAMNLKRVQLNSSQGLTDTVSAIVTADNRAGVCKQYQAITIDERQELDPFTVVRLEAEYQLQQPADPSSDIQPISNQEEPEKIVEDIAFQLACGDDNQCWSDLVLKVSARMKNQNDDVIRQELKNDIVINATETVELGIGVRNDGEDAFATVIYVTWTGSVTLQTTEATLKQPVICNDDSTEVDVDTRRVDCTVIRPVKEGSDFGVIMYFTANDISTDLSSVDFSVNIESGSNETNPLDNVANVTAKVWIDAQTKIDGKADPQEIVVPRKDRDKSMVKMLHKYFITNDGPSFLPTTDVTVKLPYFLLSSGTGKKRQDPFVNTTTVELVQEGSSTVKCLSGPERDAIKQTTTEPPRTSPSDESTDSFIPDKPPPAQLVQGPYNVIQEGNERVLIMDCVDYVCEEYVCTLQHLAAGGSAVVNVMVNIPARNLPLDDGQDIDYLMYRSKATVDQPTHPLLYPWDSMVIKHISTKIYPEVPPAQVNIWIIIGSVIGGIILLALLLLILYKLGFFKREKKGKIQKWKRESAYYKHNEPRAPKKSEAPRESAIPEETDTLTKDQ